MAKSMRSKKKRRLRTLRREIAEPFYEKKDQAKLSAQAAALAAPKIELPKRKSDMEIESVCGEGSGSVPMTIDNSDNQNLMLKPVGGIQKHGKSKSRLKKGKRKKKKKNRLNF